MTAKWVRNSFTLDQYRHNAAVVHTPGVPKALGPCWLWRGHLDPHGYGPYRRVWRLYADPIPKGWHLHHVCREKRCINPDHLLPLSPSEHAEAHAA